MPVHDLVIDPFESPYRPKKRIKTQDRIHNNIEKTQPQETPEVATSSLLANTIKASNNFPVSLKILSQNYEIELIKDALSSNQFNQKKTADALELTYHQLRGYLKKYNLLDGNLTDD